MLEWRFCCGCAVYRCISSWRSSKSGLVMRVIVLKTTSIRFSTLIHKRAGFSIQRCSKIFTDIQGIYHYHFVCICFCDGWISLKFPGAGHFLVTTYKPQVSSLLALSCFSHIRFAWWSLHVIAIWIIHTHPLEGVRRLHITEATLLELNWCTEFTEYERTSNQT